MSKHRLDLLFDTIKPILDVCIYPISHQTNMMLSFLPESTSTDCNQKDFHGLHLLAF